MNLDELIKSQKVLTLEDIDFAKKTQVVGYVTPELAKELLARNFNNNRQLSENRVRFLVNEIKHGNWVEADSIKFAENGNLIDGQHRLTALITWGKSLIFRIDTGYPFHTSMVLDTGKKRTTTDMAHIMGYTEIDQYHVSIFRAMVNLQFGSKGVLKKYSSKDIAEFVVKHLDAINFSRQHYTKGGTFSGAALGVIACAWYSQDHDLLNRFLYVFQTMNIEEPKDKSPIVLRRMIDDYNVVGDSSALGQLGMMQRAQSALRFYLNGEIPKIVSFQPVKKVLYPVPSVQSL